MTDFQYKTTLKMAAKMFKNCKTVEEYQSVLDELNELAGEPKKQNKSKKEQAQ